MRALVYKSTGNWYHVKSEGQLFKVRLKGKFKIDAITSTNPIAVGDWVEVEPGEDDSLVISKIYERHNYINRVSPHNKKQHHIVASNIDQSLLFATLRDPKTSSGFIDRFLVTCEAYHIQAIIIFNKYDVYSQKDLLLFHHLMEVYEAAGYQVIKASIIRNEGVEDIKGILKNKTTLLSGHSGVGKSTFINCLFPQLQLKTSEVSDWSGKGLHTTTFAEMFDLPFGGRIIDTPGIREMGLVDVSKTELSHYFPEMRALLPHCKYNNCLHIDEQACAVKSALSKGKISEIRYINYLKIMDTIIEDNY